MWEPSCRFSERYSRILRPPMNSRRLGTLQGHSAGLSAGFSGGGYSKDTRQALSENGQGNLWLGPLAGALQVALPGYSAGSLRASSVGTQGPGPGDRHTEEPRLQGMVRTSPAVGVRVQGSLDFSLGFQALGLRKLEKSCSESQCALKPISCKNEPLAMATSTKQTPTSFTWQVLKYPSPLLKYTAS